MSGFYWDSANPTPVIEFAVSSSTVTVSTSGVCKVLFPKQGTNGLMQELDLSGRSYSCNFSTYPNSALCGITEANWASAMPWFVYLVNTNNTAAGVYACITRNPKMSVTPAAAEINDTDAVSASQVQTTINSFTTHDNSTAAVPCICIGSLTMTYATATKKWTPAALASTDGFGKFQEGVQFTMPIAQNGAEAGKLFTSVDGATTLAFDADNMSVYTVNRNGEVSSTQNFATQSANGGDGALVRFSVPLAVKASPPNYFAGSGRALINGVVSAVMPYTTAGTAYVQAIYTNASAGGNINDNVFANTDDFIYFTIRYPAF